MVQILNKQTDSRLNIIPPAIVLLCIGTRVRASASARLPVQVAFSALVQSKPILPQPHPLRLFSPSILSIVSIIDGEGAHVENGWFTRAYRIVTSMASHVLVEITPASAVLACIFRTRLRMFETTPSLLNSRNSLLASRVGAFASALSQRRREH